MGEAGRVRSTVLVLMFVLSVILSIYSVNASGETRGSWTYHSSGEIAVMLSDLADDHPDICTYTTAQYLLGTRDIPGDREIPILFVGNFEDDSRPYLMLIGAHHGNEPDSAETVLAFAVDLLEGYDSGTDLNERIVDNVNVAILPVVNPYGLDNGLRVDENGEDPNRDYPFDPSDSGYQSDGIPLTTAGASAVHSLASMYPFTAALSYHTGSKGIFTPWGADLPASNTPDSASFQDLGRYLSRASGYDLVYGPANDFTGLGYLNGAFDDHLYGSMFMPDYLYNESFRLPHSISPCTIELINIKGENPGTLGDPSSVWDPLGEDDGTVPMGMRMSYAACEMAAPSMDLDVERTGSYHRITLECRGFTDPRDVYLTISYPNGTNNPIQRTGYEQDRILPNMEINFNLDIGPYTGFYEISAEADPNDHWLETDPEAYPLVEPQTILSRSGEFLREEVMLEIPREVQKPAEPDDYPFEIMGLSDDVFTAGEDGSVEFRVDLPGEESFQEVELKITSRPYTTHVRYRIGGPGDFDGESVVYFPSDQLLGTNSLAFPVPDLAGVGILEAVLRTDRAEYNDTWPLTIKPSIGIGYFSHSTDPGSERIDLTVLSSGVRSSTSVIYGLSRDPDQTWTGEGWLSGPIISYIQGNGTSDVTMDIPDVQGSLYLLVSDSYGSPVQVRAFQSGWEMFSSDLPARIDNEAIVLGPAVVLKSGPTDLIEAVEDISYRVFIEDGAGEMVRECRMEWVPLSDINEADVHIIRTMALEAGFDPDDLTGAWMCSIEAPEDPGRYGYYGRIESGNLTTHAGTGFDGLDAGGGQPVLSGDFVIEVEDEDSKDGFNWVILVVFGALILLIVLITVKRYPSHWKEPEPEEERVPVRKAGSRSHPLPDSRVGRGLGSLKGSNRRR